MQIISRTPKKHKLTCHLGKPEQKYCNSQLLGPDNPKLFPFLPQHKGWLLPPEVIPSASSWVLFYFFRLLIPVALMSYIKFSVEILSQYMIIISYWSPFLYHQPVTGICISAFSPPTYTSNHHCLLQPTPSPWNCSHHLRHMVQNYQSTC